MERVWGGPRDMSCAEDPSDSSCIVTDLLVAALVHILGNSPSPLLCSTSAHFFSPDELTYHSLLFMSLVCLSLAHPEVLRGDKSPPAY